MSRVRAALAHSGAGDTLACPPHVQEPLVRLANADIDMRARFIEAGNRAGMKTSRTSLGSVRESLEMILHAESPRAVLVDIGDSTLLALAGDACRALGVTTAADPGTRAFDADLAIIDATAAVAETGSVLLTSDGRRRCAWIVPPKVVILVSSRALVPDLLDLWASPTSSARAFASSPPAAMLLVSGPSKTADIEGVLVTGVHGPGKVHVVLVDDGV